MVQKQQSLCLTSHSSQLKMTNVKSLIFAPSSSRILLSVYSGCSSYLNTIQMKRGRYVKLEDILSLILKSLTIILLSSLLSPLLYFNNNVSIPKNHWLFNFYSSTTRFWSHHFLHYAEHTFASINSSYSSRFLTRINQFEEIQTVNDTLPMMICYLVLIPRLTGKLTRTVELISLDILYTPSSSHLLVDKKYNGTSYVVNRRYQPLHSSHHSPSLLLSRPCRAEFLYP